MTPVEQLLDAANRRHFREISVAANRAPAQGAKRLRAGCCGRCGKALSIAEVIEGFCEGCKADAVQGGGGHG